MSFISEDNNKKSSMRLGFMVVYISSAVLMGAMTFYIIKKSFTDGDVDWSGMGGFFAGISSIIVGAGGAKAAQKFAEKK